MPSEKSRYVNRNNHPVRIFVIEEFASQIPSLGIDKFTSILAVRSEHDVVLNKILSISLAFKKPVADINNVTKVLEYAIHVPDHGSKFFSDNDGHEFILNEILLQVELLVESGKLDLSKQVAKYSLEKGKCILEKFEAGFAWDNSLEKIETWLKKRQLLMTMKQFLNFTDINQAWILHREEIETVKDGVCNIYVLLDAYSMHCFAQELSVDLPTPSKIVNALESAILKSKARPQQVLISKSDPFVEAFRAICKKLEIPMAEHTNKDLLPFVKPFKDSFQQFQKKSTQQSTKTEMRSEVEQEELKAFVPDSYSLCPCASGKKFKFCCQKIFKDITFAMCAAEEGQHEEALKYMNAAEEKVGRTAEVVCRTAICWSYYDMDKFRLFLNEAIEINPKHPRLNYILGIEAVAAEEYDKAILLYQTAIDNYPHEDKFHLNETYNNLGTAFFKLKRYKEAKEVWEKGLIVFPTDKMTKNNLFIYIYGNPTIPKDLQEISPFIKKYLDKWLSR